MTDASPPDAALWDGVAVRYPFATADAVGPVELRVRPGERVLLLGPSGSGKSTLLLTLTALIPDSIPARVGGRIRLFGEAAQARRPWEWSSHVAQYFQDADQTLCGMRIEDEIAFALENRAVPPATIAAAVTRAMRAVGLPEAMRRRRVASLSGGEKQLAALAAVLVQDAPLVVVDEPTAHLAPRVARRLQSLLMRRRDGRSVLVVDHRLDGMIGRIDRVTALGPDGRVLAQAAPRQLFRECRAALAAAGVWTPAASTLDAALLAAGVGPPEPPLSIGEALQHLVPGKEERVRIRRARAVVERYLADASCPGRGCAPQAPVVARLEGADCAPFLGPTVLRGVHFSVREGETVGILGANGAGKSTFGFALAGLLRLKAGRRSGKPGGVAFQRPENQLLAATVFDEIAAALPKAMPADAAAAHVDACLREWGLTAFARRHPFELSQGEKRRLALAALTVDEGRWPLLVLDEPLAGLDARGAAGLVRRIEAMTLQGKAIALITHDMDLALRLCPRSIVLGEGRIVAEGATQTLLEDRDLLRRAGLTEPAIGPARRWLRSVEGC